MTKLKDKNYDYLCRSHSARSERGEMYRISPSKLTKKELEDLYFSLLENNMELKKTVNAQKDRVRVLSTRVQRITSTQKSLQARENKDCCAATKALVNEQKDSINDLKKANAHLSDRIKVLNMKLCSAKQFLNRNPMTSATRCLRCSGTSTWIKNSASSTKPDCEHYKSVSCQNLGNNVGFNSVQTETMDGQPIEAGATQTDIEESGPSSDRGCKANKCKNTMNELNQKIAYLEMELANTHCEYSERIARLEREVSAVRADNARVRGERVASQQREQHGTKLALSAARRLRDTERLCAELESSLAIEKSKVAELEAQLKMSDVSARVKKAIDEQLAALNITAAVPSNQKSDVKDNQPPKPAPLVGMPLSMPLEKDNESLIPLTGEDNIKVLNDIDEKPELQRDNISTKSLQNLTKNAGNDVKSDDMVSVKSPDDSKKVNEESATDVIKLTEEGPVVSEQELKEEQLRKKMAELQEEVDALKRAAAEQHNEIVFSENQPTPPVVNDYKFNHDNAPDNLYINKVKSSDTVDNMERADTNYALGTPANSYHKPILMTDAHAVTDSVANKNNNHDKTSNLEERHVKSVVSIQEPENKVSKPGKYAQQSVSKEDSCRKTDVISQDFSLRDTDTEPRDLFANSTNRPPISLESPKKLSYDFTGRPSWFVKDSEDMRVLKTNRVDSGEKNTTEQVGESLTRKNSNDPGDADVKQNDVQDTSCPTTGYKKLLQTEEDIRMNPLLEAKSRKNEDDPPAIVEVPSSIKRRLSNGSDGVTYTVKAPEPPSNMPQIGTYTIIQQNRDRLSDPRVSSTEVVESRPVSPDTDREISRMTDLPSEKDATTTPGPRSLSPGEELVDKATTTNTDTSTSPYHEPLSEGEVPIAVKPLKVEAQRKSRVQQMESALADVTEELARTRYLMRNSRQTLPQTQPPVPDSEGLVELRPTPAKPSIGVEASKCTFTLQIGSIVLSDEALIYTTDKRLMVTWQFYTQNVTMTRVRSGRVLLFDFSTEYEVKITDEFLDYMSNNSLPIKICEVNTDEDEAVATCSLPLREFLTRVNERVGLSVPLLRGSGSICSMSAELGVVDVSCMLRCEQAALQKALNSRQSSSSVDQRLTTAALASAAGASEEPKTADKDNQTNTEAVKLRNQSDNTELRQTSDIATQNQTTRDVKDNYVQVNPVLVPPVYHPERFRGQSQTLDSPPKCRISDDINPQIVSPESSKIYINEVPTKIRTEKDMKDALERASHETDSFLSNFGPNEDCTSIAHSLSNWRNGKFHRNKSFRPDFQQKLSRSIERRASDDTLALSDKSNRSKKFVTIDTQKINPGIEFPQKHASGGTDELTRQKIDVTVLWLALNEGSTVMVDPKVQRLYIAYTFLGRAGADLETPISIPKPKSYGDKCYFNFTKTFYLSESDLVLLGHMAKCRSAERGRAVGDCVVFSVVSEPAPAPAHSPGACEDQGYAYLYLGDLLSYGTDSTSYTEVLPVRSKTGEDVCGVLAVRIDGLDVIRRCLFLAKSTSF